jgi:resuscitation-promoting factor RpfA
MSFLHTSLRHARARSAGLAVGVLAGLTGAVLAAAPASATPGDPFAALRQCESGGNYAINTGNGYYGAYQFDTGTWRSLGHSGLPSAASPAEQDAAARTLQAQRGWAPWPGCRAKLGLDSYSVSAAPQPARTTSASRSTARAPIAGTTFTVALAGQVRDDVRAWQQQMVALGYPLVVDGQYGPASARATHDFEVQHGLHVEALGVVGPQVRAAVAQAVAAH